MRKASKGIVIGLTMATIAAMAVPSHATATGAVAFQCTANLPQFPSPGNTGTCSGLATGALAGQTNSGDTYRMAGLSGFQASFSYNELCILTSFVNDPPVIGFASGTATLGPWAAMVGATVTTGTAGVPFQWARVGLTAVVLVGGLSGQGNKIITFGNGDTASDAIGGVAVAGFVPLVNAGNVCPVGGPLQAQVIGADLEIV